MPELPEVETVVRDVGPLLVGRRISGVEVSPHELRRPWVADWKTLLIGHEIVNVRRRGKWIIIALTNGPHILIHLGMTGQLRVVDTTEPMPDHTHVIFALGKGGRQLRFRDIRRFGSVSVYETFVDLDAFFNGSGLGPEPWEMTTERWRRAFADTERCLKAVLLDQNAVAGVGNIYADESLYEARLYPGRRGCELTSAEAVRLGRAVVKVLDRAIEKRGSSIRNYVGGNGLKGGYQEEFRAYGRTGEPCRRCQTPIERIRLAGRSTHYCPKCQVKDEQ